MLFLPKMQKLSFSLCFCYLKKTTILIYEYLHVWLQQVKASALENEDVVNHQSRDANKSQSLSETIKYQSVLKKEAERLSRSENKEPIAVSLVFFFFLCSTV